MWRLFELRLLARILFIKLVRQHSDMDVHRVLLETGRGVATTTQLSFRPVLLMVFQGDLCLCVCFMCADVLCARLEVEVSFYQRLHLIPLILSVVVNDFYKEHFSLIRGRSTNWRFLSSISRVSGTLEKIATLWTETANSWTSLVPIESKSKRADNFVQF